MSIDTITLTGIGNGAWTENYLCYTWCDMVDILRVIFSGLFLSPVLAFGKTFNLRDIPANLAIAPDAHAYRSEWFANKFMCLNTVQA